MGVKKDEIKLRIRSEKKQTLSRIAKTNQISMNQLILNLIDRGLEKENLFSTETERLLTSDLQRLISILVALKIEISPEKILDLTNMLDNIISRLSNILCLK